MHTRTLVAAVVVGAVAGCAPMRLQTPPPPPRTTNAAPPPPSQPASPPVSPAPDYPVVNNLGRELTPDDHARIARASEWVTLYVARDYTQPYPGYPVDRLTEISTGDVLERVKALPPPDREAYDEGTKQRYSRTAKIIDVFVNPDGLIVNIHTTDTHSIATEAAYELTTTPCPAGLCVATATTVDTE